MDMQTAFAGRVRHRDGSSRRRNAVMLVLFFAIGLLAFGVYAATGWANIDSARTGILAPIIVSVILSTIPVLICVVQSTSVTRQLEKLDSLRDMPVYGTTYFRVARLSLGTVSDQSLTGDYLVPVIAFSIVTSIACFMVTAAFYFSSLLNTHNAILGGMMLVTPNVSEAALIQYQQGTYLVACMAFIGSYVYTITRLLDRVGNNDLYPISLHYYSAHLVVGCLVATVLRHGISALGVGDNSGMLVLLGFATGVAPDLIIVTMLRRAFQAVKVFGSKDDPDSKYRPEALPLLMLDDLTKDKVDRLNELGIDSAQVLARQNPFTIWPKLPFDLVLLVDWIAEAQLYALLKAPALKYARLRLVYDIFDLETRLRDADALPELCKALGIDTAEAPALLLQLQTDPSYTRLREVRDALLVKVPAQVPQKV